MFVVLMLGTGLGNLAAASDTRPNFIFLLADDLGYGDPACFGGKAVATPNLDRLADDGMKWTQFYAASAVCTPTRASVHTGQYPLRFDIRQHFPGTNDKHLPTSTITLPELLQAAGYATAHIGKWDQGRLILARTRDPARALPGPLQHGYDHYLCQREEQPFRGNMLRNRTLYRKGGTCLLRNEKAVPPDDPYYPQHLTDIIGDETVRLIGEYAAKKKPFFLNVWWNVPHTPYEPAPEPFWSQTAAEGISENQHRFRSMVAHMDHKIGQIVAKLDELGIRDNTFILFTSDNGGAYEADIGPLKGGKTDLHEGGIRVPMIASWPGKISPGTTCNLVGHTNDILPTFCAAAGVNVPPEAKVDGISLLPLLTGKETTQAPRTLFWQLDLYNPIQRHYPKPKPYATAAVRRGPWKLLAKGDRPVELFNIEEDLTEKTNLLKKKPRLVAELQDELRAFLAAPRDRSGQATPTF
ncbi:MAG: sulfatase-like hydrolase/transferase [Pirellulales bacterium]|nr:sulfatase-like hydrolase/transferase [Pirellulales bacterium]